MDLNDMDFNLADKNEPSRKPLGSLGRDEMNLAEFPIALLTDRVPMTQTEAVYEDTIYDDRCSRPLTRRLTIKAGGYGLTTAADDEVLLALIQLTKLKNNFLDRRVDFTRLELIELLGWPSHGASYERILLSFQRWTSVYFQYENAWRDNCTKTWESPQGFHILDNFEINDSRDFGETVNLQRSWRSCTCIYWNAVIFESFQAGYLKPLDYDLCSGLRNSTAKRLFRFLDKRFYHKTDWTFDLKEFAFMHIGLSRRYEGPAHVKRNLRPAIVELEQIGYLEPLSEEERYSKDGNDWKVHFTRKGSTSTSQTVAQSTGEPKLTSDTLVTKLVERDVTDVVAIKLVESHDAEFIEAKIEVFDWLKGKNDKRIAKNPAGYLVSSINDNYKHPKGFVSKAEQQRIRDAKEVSERAVAEERSRRREQDAVERAEQQAIDKYWNSLTPEQRAELDCKSLEQADPETLVMETGPMKKLGQTIRRQGYIRKILREQGKLPTRASGL
jgi:hypothetical protein